PSVLLPVWDLYYSYSIDQLIRSPLTLVMIIFWNCILIVSVDQMTQVTGIFFAHFYLIIYYFKKQFLFLKLNLDLCEKPNPWKYPAIYKIFRKITQVSVRFLTWNRQICLSNSICYYIGKLHGSE